MSRPPKTSSLTLAERQVVFPYVERGASRPETSVDNAVKALACYGVAACSFKMYTEESLLDWTWRNAPQVIPAVRNLEIVSDGWRLGGAGILSALGITATQDVKLVPDIGPNGVQGGLWYYINPNIDASHMRPFGIAMQVRFALLAEGARSFNSPNDTIAWLEQYNDARVNEFGTLLDVHYDNPNARPRLTMA